MRVVLELVANMAQGGDGELPERELQRQLLARSVRRQLQGMLEANGVRGIDDVAAARFLEACAS